MLSLLEQLMAELGTIKSKPSSVLLMAEMMKEFTINLAGLVAFASDNKDVKGLTMRLANDYTTLMTDREHINDGSFDGLVRTNLMATLKRALEDLKGG